MLIKFYLHNSFNYYGLISFTVELTVNVVLLY